MTFAPFRHFCACSSVKITTISAFGGPVDSFFDFLSFFDAFCDFSACARFVLRATHMRHTYVINETGGKFSAGAKYLEYASIPKGHGYV